MALWLRMVSSWAFGPVCGYPSLGTFMRKVLWQKSLGPDFRYVVGNAKSGSKPSCGLNAKARRVAGRNLVLYDNYKRESQVFGCGESCKWLVKMDYWPD
jgi:hypothetical protein